MHKPTETDGIVRREASHDRALGGEFIISDDSIDSYGDIIVQSGWKLARFKSNPIALFGHDSKFPIGKWTDIRVDGNRTLARLELAAQGTSPRIDELRALVDQGILRAVSVGFRPLKAEPIKGGNGYRFLENDLHEVSLVSVPANANAVQVAKSMHISEPTMALVFGEHAGTRQRDVISPGGNATKTSVTHRPTTMTTMTLSQRIENTQNDLNAKRDRLAELNAAEDFDPDAVDELTRQIDGLERELAIRKAAEAKIGANAAAASSVASPGLVRRPLGFPQQEIKGFDLLVRATAVRGIAHFGGKTIDKVLDERYPGHEATALITKADQTIGTTTVSGWASELVQTVNQGFLQALMPYSIYPALRARGIGVSFDGIGTVSLPSRTAGGAGGGFVAEGAPIRVGRITTAATTMTPKKLGVIVPFSRELAKRSTPAIEALVRQAILEDTAVVLDAALLDATASSTARPAGLLYGVSAVATGYGGGDYQAVVADLKALLAPFYAANAGDNITVLMNPAQGLALSMMPGPGAAGEFGWATPLTSRLNIIESTNVPAGRLIALRNSDFATAMGDAPEFDISESATIHLEDTTPLEIVSAAGTVADPVRSLWQTGTIGVRMLMDISWALRRTGMVQWVNGTSW